MPDPEISTPTAAPAREYPLPRRVLDTFVAPGRLFAHFRERTPWAGPLVITIVVGAVLVVLIPTELLLEQARESLQAAGDAAHGGPTPESLVGFARVAGLAGVIFGTPITAAAIAGVLALAFSVVAGGEARFMQYLSVTTHTLLITMLGGLLTFPLQLLAGDLGLRLSPALLVPGLDPATFAGRLLGAMEIFTLWALAVLGLGVSVLNRRISWGSAAGALFFCYAVLVAAAAALPR